jgi:hypothetical protein
MAPIRPPPGPGVLNPGVFGAITFGPGRSPQRR